MGQIEEIEVLAREYSEAEAVLIERVQGLEDEIRGLKRQHFHRIKKAAVAAREKRENLAHGIASSPDLFEKPRTRTFHGVKCGFQKQKGQIFFEDEKLVIRLIRKHFPDKEELLIKITESVIRSAIAQLTGAELKKIGVEIKDPGDEIFIRSVASEVMKFVEALLKEEDYPLEVA